VHRNGEVSSPKPSGEMVQRTRGGGFIRAGVVKRINIDMCIAIMRRYLSKSQTLKV
jgi:hypothetical protein